MEKGYFAVYFDGSTFETTSTFKSLRNLKKEVNWFEEPVAQGHIVIFESDGRAFFPVEEAWAPTEPSLNWRKFQKS